MRCGSKTFFLSFHLGKEPRSAGNGKIPLMVRGRIMFPVWTAEMPMCGQCGNWGEDGGNEKGTTTVVH
jgi:hypothetical protein